MFVSQESNKRRFQKPNILRRKTKAPVRLPGASNVPSSIESVATRPNASVSLQETTIEDQQLHTITKNTCEKPFQTVEKDPVQNIIFFNQIETIDPKQSSQNVENNESGLLVNVVNYSEENPVQPSVNVESFFNNGENRDLLVENVGDTEIYWDRPWYQLYKSLTRPLKQDIEDDEKKEGMYKIDSFSSDERKLVNKNWRKFIKKFNVPDKPLCFARWRNTVKNCELPEEKVRYFVTAYLARGLQRNLYQVYKHIVTYYGAPVKGSYSPAEEKIMKICFQHDPHNAVTICAKVLSREPRGLYKKLHISKNGKRKKKSLKWTLPLANKFIKLLLEYTDLPLEKLKYRKIDKDVWLKMEKDLDQHYVYLQQFWFRYLHVQLFVKDYVTLRRLRKKIYKKLQASPYKIWSDIRWKEVLQMFPDGFTHQFLYRVAHRGLNGLINYLKVPLEEVIEYGLYNLKKNRNHYDKVLKNLTVDENGDLITCKHYYITK